MEEEPVPGRCGCASDHCGCYIVAGQGARVDGTGSRTNPLVISLDAPAVEDGGEPAPVVAHVPGEITMWGGLTAPDGALLCNGAAVSRAVYSDVFAVLGTSYGAGDGETTFNLPNLVGKFPMGVSGSELRGATGGSAAVTLTVGNLPAHTHAIDHDHASFTTASGGGHVHGHAQFHGNNDGISNQVTKDGSTTEAVANPADGLHTHDVNVPAYTGASGSTGSGTAVNTRPPFVAVNFIIWT